MGERVRALEWSTTPLGPIDEWPHHLRLAVSICLNSGLPIALYWGPEFTLIYNDAWTPIPGDKHPWALGRPAHEVWPEIWDVIRPNFQQVIATGEAYSATDALFFMRRHGYTEECYFDYTLGPICGTEGAVDGIFNAAMETTYRVLGERRTRLLRELAEHTAPARSPEEACALAAETFSAATQDVPFALLYLVDADGRHAGLAGIVGIASDGPASPLVVDLDGADTDSWPLAAVARTGEPQLVSDLASRFGRLPGGSWPEPSGQALVLPIGAAGPGRLAGFLVAGISPRRALDADYRSFFELAAGHLATALTNARAYQMERQRAEALAELDRAKTAFFSNVSHEFRTPLTLILGPLEDLLAQEQIPAGIQESLTVVHRNSLRLMRLVNTLLDFSRIEAGRVRASYEPTDLAALTADLVSSFRSACEKAGLQLVVDCPPLPEPVYVDGDMWEKIVLNLVSNAFKFTFEGEIKVKLHADGDHCELSVRDTGIGIPEAELPRIFERFYRPKEARGRTFEGTGIGLALVQELAKLHGGSVRVQSDVGKGSTFTVTLPFGTAHLPADRIGVAQQPSSMSMGARPYVEEARQWFVRDKASGESTAAPLLAPDRAMEVPPSDARQDRPGVERPQVLLADDNADMREYVRRLLASRYEVEVVSDGQAALEAARRSRPALVLADVMMPRLDGFALLRTLRADPRLRTVPVVLLSARAGEESRVEGLEAGADDYLIKPFSARELLARGTVNLELVRLREEVERAAGREEALRLLAGIVESSGDAIIGTNLAGLVTAWNEGAERMFGYPAAEALGRPVSILDPPGETDKGPRILEQIRRGELIEPVETERMRKDGQRIPVSLSVSPIRDGTGQLIGASRIARDITERKRAEEELRAYRDRLEDLVTERTAELAAARDKAQRLTFHLESVREELSAKIAREVHDELGGTLTMLKLGLGSLLEKTGQNEPVRATLSSLLELADTTIQIVKRISSTLRPLMLDTLGLVPTIKWHAREFSRLTGIACELRLPEHIRLSREGSTGVYRIVQEALTNVARHAKATKVTIRARKSKTQLTLEITDNGLGIAEDAAAEYASYGIIGMRERSEHLGGDFHIEGVPGRGTAIILRLPLPDQPGHDHDHVP